MPQPSTQKRKSNPADATDKPTNKKRKPPKASESRPFSSVSSPPIQDDVPFTVDCPVRRLTQGGKKRKLEGQRFGPEYEDGGYPELKIAYAIRPGAAWRDLNTYRNFSIQSEKFPTGSLVYINTQTPPPEPLDSDASDAELLAFDKQYHWVGKVLEVRAADSSQVWLRVFWVYWPEELPQGRQDYHGSQELVMSNHMEIVDAKTVTSGADICYWDEYIEDQDVGKRFWRQFYDVQQQGDKTGGLSVIRRHCICNGYYNPDKTMLKCPKPECAIWNHQECLEEAILRQKYRLLVDPISSEVKIEDGEALELSQAASGKNDKKRKKKRRKAWSSKQSRQKRLGLEDPSISCLPPSQIAPWNGLLKAEVSPGDVGSDGGSGGAMFIITDRRGKDPEVSTEPVHCLKCGTVIH